MIPLTLSLSFLCFSGFSATRLLLTLYALTSGATAAQVGMLGAMFYLFPLLLSWPIGIAADRYGPRWPLLFASACAAGALLLPFLHASMPMFFVAAALCGMSLAGYHVTLQNMMGVISAPEDRARNFANFGMMGSATNLAGPMTAGAAIDYLGHASACLVVLVLPAAAVAMLIWFAASFPHGNRKVTGGTSALKSLRDRNVVRTLITSGLVQLGTDLFQFFIPVYGHAIRLSASAIGAILSTFAVAAFVVRLMLPRLLKRYPIHHVLAASFFMGALGFAIMPLFEHVVLLSMAAFIFGLGMGIGTPVTVMLMFSSSTEGRSGQTLGLRLTVNNLVRVLGPLVFGGISGLTGIGPVFVISAAVMGVGGLLARIHKGRNAV